MKNIVHKFWLKLYFVFCVVFCAGAVVNLAFRKQTRQSSTLPVFPSLRAVDGNLTQNVFGCAHTNYPRTEVWWQVDLQNFSEIKNVTIYYRADTTGIRRLNGFQMFLHESSNTWRDRFPCYEDKEPGNPPSILTVNCSGNYRYVTIYNNKSNDQYGPILELCEVQVYGCPNFKYGAQCEKACSSNCVSSRCDVDNGHCLKGCITDHFGHDCTHECNCLAEGCNRINGSCYIPGCKYGWQGVSCNKSCQNNTFGHECNATCYCLNGTCDRFRGECYQPGCQPGYIHHNCSTACKNNTFGINCDTICHCQNGGCNNMNGICDIPGCKDGWKGISCDIPCKDNAFGGDCNATCYCLNGSCDRFSGECRQAGCKPGYIHQNCSTACKNNSYGFNCDTTCHCQIGGCNNVNGVCHIPGCKDGWKGASCEELCDRNTFGKACGKICHCLNGTCDPVTGICFIKGCDLGWSDETCSVGTNDLNQIQTTWIIVGLLVALIILVLLVAVIIYRNRRTKSREIRDINLSNIGTLQTNIVPSSISNSAGCTYFTINKQSEEHIYLTIEEPQLKEDANFKENNKLTTLIHVSDLKSILEKQTSDTILDKEYKSIPFGKLYQCKVGEQKRNKEKNRLLDLFPYDHSRVILEKINNDPDSEYINANYIDGVDKRSAYVATQGPKENTVEDFWRMVWQIKCGKIVMLTDIVEKGKVKCHQYWPDLPKVIRIGDFELTSLSESESLCFTERQFSLTEKQSGQVRTIHQFHFNAWPDQDTLVPSQLVLFHRNYMEIDSEQDGPTIVHCSSGVGRTGTFIALDALFQYGKNHGEIDICEYVKIMTTNRMNMIHTKNQYVAIYELLYESFKEKDTSLSMDEFIRTLRNKSSRIDDEFKTLRNNIQKIDQSLNHHHTLQYESKANGPEICPVEEFRPQLPDDSSTSNKIKAVTVPSYTESVGFLVLPCPMPDTIEDFWCMVQSYQSTTIVVLDCFSACKERFEWIPCDSSEIQFGSFKLRKKREPTQFSNTNERQLSLLYEGNTRTVKVFELLDWNASDSIPSSKKSLVELVKLVESWRHTRGKGPIIVVCMDGAKCCGLFCATYNILQKLENEDSVDIFQTVKQLQSRKPEFFSSLEQYQFLYKMIQDHIIEANVYFN